MPFGWVTVLMLHTIDMAGSAIDWAGKNLVVCVCDLE